MKKSVCKIASLLVIISMLLTLFTVFPMAEEGAGEQGGVKVVYNRGYEDGWDYDNGLDDSFKNELDLNLSYTKKSVSWYDYYMKFSPAGDRGGYMGISLGDDIQNSGKIFLEFDLSVSDNNNIGDILLIKGAADGSLYHILGIEEGELYLLGEKAAIAPTYFTKVSFVFDFDYAKNNIEAKSNEFLVTVSTESGVTKSRVYEAEGGFGISDVYFGAEENFLGRERDGDYYLVDNLKLYYGVDEACELAINDYGTAVDLSVPRDFTVLGTGSVGGYLSGVPTIERTEPSENSKLYYNRYFSEGWDFYEGTTGTANLRNNGFSISTDFESRLAMGDADYLNYYFEFIQRNTSDGFITLEVLTQAVEYNDKGKAYFEFDLKASPGATIANMLTFLTPGAPILYYSPLSIKNGALYVLEQNVGQIGEEWCRIIFEMDFEYGEEIGDPTAIKYTAYIGSENITVSTVKNVENHKTAFRGIRQIRIGKGGSNAATTRDGDWYGIDNVQFYSSTVGAVNYSFDDPGVLVDRNASKPISIGSVSGSVGTGNAVDTSLTMKVNSNNALLFGEKVKLFEDANGIAFGGPYKVDGKVMVPLQSIIDYTKVPARYNSDGLGCDIFVGGSYRTLAVGRDTVRINDEIFSLSKAPEIKTFGDTQLMYICLDDVERLFDGFYVTWDEVGFISIATVDDYLIRDIDEDYMREIMKRFIFDELAVEDVYDKLKENSNNFEHPYFYVNQDRFDYLYEVYNSEPGDEIYDEDLHGYLEYSLEYALDYYYKYAEVDGYGNYVGLKEGQWVPSSEGIVSWVTTLEEGNHSVSVMPYSETGGYDPAGGRLNVISDGETGLSMACQILAHAYQFTRNENYAKFVYDWAVALCQWEHWAPGHYLNCAQPCLNIALSYDWLYNIWVELGLDPTPIRDGLYKHGAVTSWRSLNRLPVEFYRWCGDASYYWQHVGNWNSVSASGVFAACMVAMEDPTYVEVASFSFAKTLYYLQTNGFQLFGFDGSYRETAGYWCATIRFIQYDVMLVKAVTGSDMGLLDAPGLDITNYFGSHMESSDYKRWNYGDDWEGSQETYWFYLSAILFENDEFARMRYNHIKNGKEPYRWDTLWYDPVTAKADSELSLDFVLDSTETVLSRSSWEPGALYVGLQGDKNHVAHGQFDSGNWIYDNGGVRWFLDLGADNYNLAGGGFASGYFKYSAEGQNTIAIGTIPSIMPYGQMYEDGGKLASAITNKHGSVAILDQSGTFGGSEHVTYARRGMFLTNDRKTVVIQDEINTVLAQDIYWFAHFNKNAVSATLSEDGRTAYMKAISPITGETLTLRVSLVTSNRGFKFEIWDAYTFALDATPRPDYSPSINGLYEVNRNYINRLVVTGKNVLKFEIAVVIELIDPDAPVELGYKLGWEGQKNSLRPMSTWVPEADTRGLVDIPDTVVVPTRKPNTSAIIMQGKNLAGYLSAGDYLGANRDIFFRALGDVGYSLEYHQKYRPDALNSAEMQSSIASYEEAKEIYTKYRDKAAEYSTALSNISRGLIGIKETEAEE